MLEGGAWLLFLASAKIWPLLHLWGPQNHLLHLAFLNIRPARQENSAGHPTHFGVL